MRSRNTTDIISLVFVLVWFLVQAQPVLADGNFYRIIPNMEATGKVDLGYFSDGDTAEIEYRFTPSTHINSTPSPAVYFQVCTPEGMATSYLRNVDGHWCAYFTPIGSSTYARKYYFKNLVNNKGLNRIRVTRKDNWLSLYTNDTMFASLPVNNKYVGVFILPEDMLFDYRWVKRFFKTSTMEETISARGGQYFEVPTLYQLNDGSQVRFKFTPLRTFKNTEFSSSFVFTVGDTAFWLNHAQEYAMV